MKTFYVKGQHNFECMICMGWYKSSEKKINWDNQIVCRDCWDPKPWFMYKIPVLNELRPVPNPSPDTQPIFRNVTPPDPTPTYKTPPLPLTWDTLMGQWDETESKWEDAE